MRFNGRHISLLLLAAALLFVINMPVWAQATSVLGEVVDPSGTVVDVGLGLTFNAVLELGSISMVVEVGSAAGAELQTMNSTVSSVVSGQSLTLLPNPGRPGVLHNTLRELVVHETSTAPGCAITNGIMQSL